MRAVVRMNGAEFGSLFKPRYLWECSQEGRKQRGNPPRGVRVSLSSSSSLHFWEILYLMMQNDPSFISVEGMPAARTGFDLALGLQDLHHLGMSSPSLPTFPGRESSALEGFPSPSSNMEGEEPPVPRELAGQQWCTNHLRPLLVLRELCSVLATPNFTTKKKKNQSLISYVCAGPERCW